MKKKIFVIGIGGLLGYNIAKKAQKKYKVYGSYNFRNPKLNFVNSFKLDLVDFEKTNHIIRKIQPNVIINAAAISNVDYCEKNQKECEKINVELVQNLTNLSQDLGTKLVHISSDSVFDGEKNKPYNENDDSNPINVYGKTKLESEKIVLKNQKNLIVRASVLYGWLPDKISTINSSSMKSMNFAQWLIKELEENKKIQIVTDEFSSPILADDFAKSILHLIEKDLNGIFHSGPEISINRFEFSKSIAKILEFNLDLILPTTIKELGRKVSTGKNKALNSQKLVNTDFKFLTLNESLMVLKEQIMNKH